MMRMICERCKKKNASVIHRDLRAGRVRVRHLCAECTEILEATGELRDISTALPPYMAPLAEDEGGCFPFFLPTGSNAAGGKTAPCPLCGMSEDELIAAGRAGCPMCYTAFGGLLSGSIRAMQGANVHKGRLPAAVRRKQERSARLLELRRSLEEAVRAEDYERAVGLRDEIRALEASGVA